MIENQTSIARYTGNGTIKEFSIPFSFYKNADGAPEIYQIAVYQRDEGQAEKKLDQGTDYSVTWEEATLSGKIVLATALPNKSILAIIREVPPSQEVEYKANEPFPYDGTNTALDKLTMLVQEHEEALSRKLGVTPTYDKTADETMVDVINAKESAEASAVAAKASATEAKGYAQEAGNAKVEAVEAKDLAVEAADSAELYAQNAESSKQGADAALAQLDEQVELAQAAADEADAAKQSAQTSADQASSSAQEAKTSEDTAVQQATEATNAQKEATRASISCAINEQRTLSYYNEVKLLAEGFQAEPATTEKYGFTRYATEAEAEAGELNNVSSTPAQVKKYADSVVSSHANRTDNPHGVTKAQIGLGMVDNTADIDKPVSTAMQEALDTKADLFEGIVPAEQIPTATTSTLGGVKPDGTTITVTADGVISAEGGSGFDFQGTKAEFDAAVAAGTITADSVSLITDDVDGANVATKAELQAVDRSKADTALSNVLANIDYVVESKLPTENDPTWYRKYKSGWLEQGGIISPSSAWSTINLLKPYANTQYIVLAAVINGNTGAGVTIKDKTISSFAIYQNVGQNWEAKGMGAN